MVREAQRALPVVFLMGPTAAGKTALAVELAQRFPVELISVDSALVYRGLNIGAARPDADALRRAPHRLLGIRDVTDPYSAADFRRDAMAEIKAIHAARRVPLLVGGTMMYFKALTQGLAVLPAANPRIRQRLEREAAAHGWPWLHARLQQIDPPTAARLAPNDSQRLQRALEVYEVTGKPLSQHHQEQKKKTLLSDTSQGFTVSFPYNVRAFAVAPQQRQVLHQRIELRLQQMFTEGFVDEVRELYCRGDVLPELPAIRAVGYRQVWKYLTGEYDYATMIEKSLVATRQLAKRQLTWLRSWPGITWLHGDNRQEILAAGLDIMGDVIGQMAAEMQRAG